MSQGSEKEEENDMKEHKIQTKDALKWRKGIRYTETRRPNFI
jgi:hypothetical protein